MNEKQVLQRTVSYDEGLLKALKDPEEARAYLEVALDECEASGEIDRLLLALRDVALAQGGVRALAERSGLNREHLYRVLSSRSIAENRQSDGHCIGLGVSDQIGFRRAVEL